MRRGVAAAAEAGGGGARGATGQRSGSEDRTAFVRGKLIMGLAAAQQGAPDTATLLPDAAAAAAAASPRIPQAEPWIAVRCM